MEIKDLTISLILCEILRDVLDGNADSQEISAKLESIEAMLRDGLVSSAWDISKKAFADRLLSDKNRRAAEIFWDEYSKQGFSSSKEDLAELIMENDPRTTKFVVNYILQGAATSRQFPFAIKFGDICRSIEKTFGAG